jgi:hypothetical protein
MTTSPDPPPSHERCPRLLLADADFDAYRPDRAASNAFTRPRLELKQRMLLWARDVVLRLQKIGVPMDAAGSDEHPTLRNAHRVDFQRVFLRRDAAARSVLERLIDQHKVSSASHLDGSMAVGKRERLRTRASDLDANHAFLGLKIDSISVEVGVELHPDAWGDVRNLRARLADPPRALQFTSALEALPEEFCLGLATDSGRVRARGAETFAIRGLLDRSEIEKSPVWLGWTIARDVAVAHAAILDEQLEDAIVALGSVYKLLAWAPDNDLLVLDREAFAAKVERARHHEEAFRAKAEWEARRAEERKPKKRTSIPRTAQEGHRRPRGELSGESDIDPKIETVPPEIAAERAAAALPTRSRATPKKLTRAFPKRAPLVTEVDPSIAVDKGVRVRVLSGPFSGKNGVVQELDGKGSARVMLGLLAMWLEVRDLIASAEGRDRPVLASSHRKMSPAR